MQSTFLTRCVKRGVDARDKRGHDEVDGPAAVSTVGLNVR
jgi:hypothetical protein